MKSLFYIIVTILFSQAVLAQQQFISQGRIEYERKTNQHALMSESNFFDELTKSKLPKFVTFYYDLFFKDDRTLFKAGREPEIKQVKTWNVFASENTVLTSLDSNLSLTQRVIFGSAYQVSDSVRHIDWRITPEIRKIAGFDCRKAVGRIMDSVVVIAFYTDEILTTGGPESVNGLPGMIMGLAIPRFHTTWYATKLALIDVTGKELEMPKKGKKMTGNEYRSQLTDILKNWGDETEKKLRNQLLL
ncbi:MULTISPECIES: GLPGLI family protein [Niastella]|uniref:GLPGLI family protein n=1 Tax=Niastella soli TaxID=2821487 RepID=A0ABS3YX56_9BACT|nr:GLPGLI family protein [Niastella soli]MBO9201731.1 GLPGLI family protein [Niastella soli]